MEWMREPLSVTFRNMGMNFGQTVIFFSEGNSLKELKLHFVRCIHISGKIALHIVGCIAFTVVARRFCMI